MTTPWQRPALDEQVIEQLRHLGEASGEDLVGQVVNLFVGSASARVAELSIASRTGDAAGALESAHSLRGSAANVGATDLAVLCAALEDTARTPNLDASIALAAAVEAEVTRVCRALEALAPTG